MPKIPKVTVSIRLPKKLAREFSKKARAEGKNKNKLIEKFVKDYVGLPRSRYTVERDTNYKYTSSVKVEGPKARPSDDAPESIAGYIKKLFNDHEF